MRNLRLSNEKVLSVRNRGIPMRSEDNEETRTEVLGGAAGTSWRAGRASATVFIWCCAALIAIGSARGQNIADIEFGNNLGDTAFDDTCNDPRFRYSDGRKSKARGENMFRDAADCRQQYERGAIELRVPEVPGMQLGANASNSNGKCEDPRFVVDPRYRKRDHSWHSAEDNAEGQDAHDCFHAWLSGEVWPLHSRHEIAFGDDTGLWPNDEECDDPRFDGEGRSDVSLRTQVLHDMTDCVTAYEKGDAEGRFSLTIVPDDPLIEFGDDTGRWSFDGECDDPRFDGDGMSEFPSKDHLQRDAVDCYREYVAERVVLLSEWVSIPNFDFGRDSGALSFDGKCDDQRFDGPGVTDNSGDEGNDATDCRRAYRAGTAELIRP